MAKRKAAPSSLYRTDLLGFDMSFYMEAIREPTWEKRPIRFPFVEERDVANIEFDSPDWRRTYYGEIPFPGPREGEGSIYGRYMTRSSFDYSSGPNRYVSQATQFKIPDGYISTTSGFVALGDGEIHPDWFGDPIGNYSYISGKESNLGGEPQEHIVGSYPGRISRQDGRPDNEYYPVAGGPTRIPRMFYASHSVPSYQAPTSPSSNYSTNSVTTRWGNPLLGPRARNRRK